MSGVWRFWVDLFSTREQATTLAALRIAVSLVLLYSLLSIAAAGLVDVLWVDARHGGLRALGEGPWLVAWLGGASPGVVWALWWTALAAGVLSLVGALGRWPLLVAGQAYLQLRALNFDVTGGYDSMILNALWLLFLSSSTATLSLDCRLREGRWTSDRRVPAWPRYLFVFQLVVVYAASGLQKVSPEWMPESGYAALHYVLQDPTWLRWEPEIFVQLLPLTRLATALTWHWEHSALLLLPILYFRHTRERGGRLRAWLNRFDLRLGWAAIGVAIHLGILLAIEVGPFSWISLSYYFALFSPGELRAAARRIPGGGSRAP